MTGKAFKLLTLLVACCIVMQAQAGLFRMHIFPQHLSDMPVLEALCIAARGRSRSDCVMIRVKDFLWQLICAPTHAVDSQGLSPLRRIDLFAIW